MYEGAVGIIENDETETARRIETGDKSEKSREFSHATIIIKSDLLDK